jgi:L-aminopeptidase/D-esterase-like protein
MTAENDTLISQNPRPGPRNLITDIAGLRVGHAAHEAARTGVSVIVPDIPAVVSVSVPGGGPGTRETDALQPGTLVDKADAIVLSGGSVYGLDAASGVTAAMGAQGRGFPTGAPVPSPIVPAAILFDVANGGDKNWGETPPYAALGREAYQQAREDFALGNIGAGYGAQAGQLKGGLGSASTQIGDRVKVGALIGANPLGSLVDAAGRFWAQPQALVYQDQLEFGLPELANQPCDATAHPFLGSKIAGALGNTSIGVVAVAADLSVAEAKRVAIMAQDGLARAVRPIHTPFDGDCLFVLATGAEKLSDDPNQRPLALAELGALAADCVARASARAIWHASQIGDCLAYHDRFGR